MGNKRGRTREEIHKKLQDLDPMGSPHKEEKVIGGNVDLISSLFSLKKMQESWKEWRGRASYSRSTMEERGCPIRDQPKEEEGVFYTPDMLQTYL
jgi:hypothetical protein